MTPDSSENDPGIQTLLRGLKYLGGSEKTQSGGHIKPIHVHCSHKLTIEGGFPPEWILPHPPLRSKRRTATEFDLRSDKSAENLSEHSVLGGIKHKNVDVTVLVPGVGPALGVSAKSTGNAFRNLTNRMEEALGDCANIHMMYPGFVFGFLHFIRYATAETGPPADASFGPGQKPLQKLIRYHDVLVSLSGRTTITDPAMRYESVGLIIYKCENGEVNLLDTYPPRDSPVHYAGFFDRLYRIYDLRYAYPDSSGKSSRKTWSPKGLDLPEAFDASVGFPWSPRFDDGLAET